MPPAVSRPARDRKCAEIDRSCAHFRGRVLPDIGFARGRRPAAWHLRRLEPDASALRIACLSGPAAQMLNPCAPILFDAGRPRGHRAVSPCGQETGAALSRALAEACGSRASHSPTRRRHTACCRRVLRSCLPSCARRLRPCRQPAHVPLICLMPGPRGAGARLADLALRPRPHVPPGRAAALAPRACDPSRTLWLGPATTAEVRGRGPAGAPASGVEDAFARHGTDRRPKRDRPLWRGGVHSPSRAGAGMGRRRATGRPFDSARS